MSEYFNKSNYSLLGSFRISLVRAVCFACRELISEILKEFVKQSSRNGEGVYETRPN